MSATPWMEPIADLPRPKVTLAGFLYLIAAAAGATTVFLDEKVLVHGNAAATTANVLVLEPLFRLSFVSNVVATACCIAVTLLLYRAFEEVDRKLSFVAAFISAETCLLGALVALLHIAPLVLVRSARALSILDVQALRALVLRLLELNSNAAVTGMLSFAVYSILIGYLAFWPRGAKLSSPLETSRPRDLMTRLDND